MISSSYRINGNADICKASFKILQVSSTFLIVSHFCSKRWIVILQLMPALQAAGGLGVEANVFYLVWSIC